MPSRIWTADTSLPELRLASYFTQLLELSKKSRFDWHLRYQERMNNDGMLSPIFLDPSLGWNPDLLIYGRLRVVLIFLRDSRVGEHASARENHLEETRLAARSLPLDYPWEK